MRSVHWSGKAGAYGSLRETARHLEDLRATCKTAAAPEDRLNPDARAIYGALPTDGSRISNAALRSRSELRHIGNGDYPKAKEELVRSGLVR